jgi:hypothetical protein
MEKITLETITRKERSSLLRNSPLSRLWHFYFGK